MKTSKRRRYLRSLQKQLAAKDRRIATLVKEQGMLKAACHKNAHKRNPSAVEWSDYEAQIKALKETIATLERRLAARNPEARRVMRMEQKRREDDRASTAKMIHKAKLAA